MRILWMCVFLFAGCLWFQTVQADVYVWTDESGMRHFSNRPDHPGAELFLKTMEGPYEEAVERARDLAEKQQALAQAQAEIREERARLAARAVALERRAEEARRKAQEAMDRIDAMADAAERRYRESRWYSIGYGYYYPRYYDDWINGSYGYRYHSHAGLGFSVTRPGRKGYRKHHDRHDRIRKKIDTDRHSSRHHRIGRDRYSRYRHHHLGRSNHPDYRHRSAGYGRSRGYHLSSRRF